MVESPSSCFINSSWPQCLRRASIYKNGTDISQNIRWEKLLAKARKNTASELRVLYNFPKSQHHISTHPQTTHRNWIRPSTTTTRCLYTHSADFHPVIPSHLNFGCSPLICSILHVVPYVCVCVIHVVCVYVLCVVFRWRARYLDYCHMPDGVFICSSCDTICAELRGVCGLSA